MYKKQGAKAPKENTEKVLFDYVVPNMVMEVMFRSNKGDVKGA
jgi:hypothetical protein